MSLHFVNKKFVFFKFHIYNILLHIEHTHGKLEVIYFSTLFLGPNFKDFEPFFNIFYFLLFCRKPKACVVFSMKINGV